MPKIIQVEAEILSILLTSKYGFSIAKLADKLGYSRTTISKYLNILQQKQKIFSQDVGQYKLWHHGEGFFKSNNDFTLVSLFFQPYYKAMMKNLPTYQITDGQFKELGQKISEELDLSELVEKFIELSTSTIAESNFDNFHALADINMDIINTLFTGIDAFIWNTPLFFPSEHFFILRMAGSKFIQISAHFHLLCGIIEFQMQKYANFSMDIHQINEEEAIVDFKFQYLGSRI
ncbi:MAG: helix-turn-helix domain-containing protein [Promethearchaeota archaeon]